MTKRPTIPAEVRREVLVEAGHRCLIPACKDSANIDLHHIVPWAKCREHKPDNLVALCPSCHRLAHDGTIDRKSLRKYKEISQKLINPPIKHEETDALAYIKFDPNSVVNILDAKNISSLVDNGLLDFSFNFTKPFDDESYVIGALGDGVVSFKVVSKTCSLVHLKFDSPCPHLVKLVFQY
ncbi:HNH endonuclease [Vibrio sp. 10N.286.46.A8]|uniref:HNH endonuclease n=1 Tax=Vibrio sp. 10N.286.46.A8 TaxID=3229697 RepID=UPI00355361B5